MKAITEALYQEYLVCLLAGDRRRCRQMVQGLLDGGIGIPALYTELFQRSLHQVGALWESNRVSVAVEHLATAITESLLSLAHPSLFARERVGKTAVVSCCADECHQMGGKMVADLFELHGWNGYFLGANTPTDDLLRMIRERRPDVLALSLSMDSNLPALLEALRCVTEAFPSLEVLVGGQAFAFGTRERVTGFPRVRVMTTLGELDAFLGHGVSDPALVSAGLSPGAARQDAGLAASPVPVGRTAAPGSASVLYFEFDDCGVVLAANRHALSVLGADLVGRPVRSVFLDLAQTLDFAALAEQSGVEHVLGVAMPSGCAEAWRFTLARHGERTLALGRLDVEGKELLEGQILSLNAELINRVRELQKANAELAQVSRLKDQFLGMAAHDLRNPLGLILGYSDLLISDTSARLSEEHLELLTLVRDAGSAMRRLIDDFLDVSMIESGNLKLVPVPTDIREVVVGSVRLVEAAAQRLQVTLDVRHGPVLPLVTMDGARIGQALTNLLSNAVEHSAAGRTVTLTTEVAEAALWITVKDEGPGISAEGLRGLFAPFGSGPTPKSSGERSIGLGLAIARKVVEAHHGRIAVVSELGVGSEFRVVLPLQPEATRPG